MKSIKNYIENYLNESLSNNDDVLLVTENDKKAIEKWIRDNYDIFGNLTISDDLIVDCNGDVYIRNKSITSLTNGLFRWGEFGGNFDCSECENLTSLKGSPKKVNGGFDCGYCKKLISLEGAPKETRGDFCCNYCKNLKSLKGAPEVVRGDFYCSYCDNLKTLEGAPKEVSGDFDCGYCKGLISLKGAPEKVGKNFYCGDCKKLKITDSDRKKYKIEN